MGFWFNNFQEFERKQKGNNRLILNFYYVPSVGEKARKVKVFAKTNIKIPTGFIFEDEKVEEIKKRISEDPDLCDFYVDNVGVGKYTVLEIEMLKNKELIDKLPPGFEKGNYDKLFRLGGFYPERKLRPSKRLDKLLVNNSEVELSQLESCFDFEFLSAGEMKNMPWLYFDIEKPMWKSDEEKRLLKRRKKLIKAKKKYDLLKQDRAERLIKRLEERLTVEIDGVGKIGLYEEQYDSKVSSIASIWKNCNGERESKEVYILDPTGEFNRTEIDGYKVFSFKTEKELINHFSDKTDKRMPLFCSGHNEVYDITQVREAAKKNKEKFHPAVEEINPKRDFVRFFFQRLKQDLIYIDTLWLNRFFYPWLQQRSLGSSLKLESVANFHGIDFKKSLTHADLRTVEVQRFSGKTKAIRKKASDRMFEYVCGDVDPVVQIIENAPFMSLIEKMKCIMPYCTTTELAFHTNCVNKYHDNKHFQRTGNHRYYKYKQKMRENELQIFKKRFPSLKKKMLNWAGINTTPKKGDHENVYEIYLPFEEWIRESAFKWSPRFKLLYKSLEENEQIPFLRYLNNLERDMLTDYYFTKRETKIFKKYPIEMDKVETIERVIDKELLDSYYGSFNFLKNHFRSIYVALEGKGRGIIRNSKKDFGQPYLFEEMAPMEIPGVMGHEKDLFLLRENAEIVRSKLTFGNKRKLASFLNNFEKFEILGNEIAEKIKNIYTNENGKEIAFLYNQFKRKQTNENRFYGKWRQSVGDLTRLIGQSYKNLASELERYDCEIIDHKGDYLFIKSDKDIRKSDLFYVVRELPTYNNGMLNEEELFD